jgi:hypothetical protein
MPEDRRVHDSDGADEIVNDEEGSKIGLLSIPWIVAVEGPRRSIMTIRHNRINRSVRFFAHP